MFTSTTLAQNSAQNSGLVMRRRGSLCASPARFGDAAKRVIHCPVEAGVERRHLLTGAWKLMRRCILRRAHRDFDEEIALDGVPAFLEVKLSLNGNRLDS